MLNHYGLEADRNGMLCCPFHADKTPSMQLSGEAVYCHSTNCSRHGKHIDVIDFVMYKEGLTKHDAILKCKAMAGEVLIKQSKTSQQIEPQVEDFTEVYAQMLAAVSRSSKAREYLERRGLEELSDVGYNPGTLYRGVRQCVVFPLRNQTGEVVSLYGRSITDGKARHFYTSNRSGLYPGWPVAGATRLVLTESVIDAATLQLNTNEKVLALYGTNGLGDEHFTALDALVNLNELILFFDGDAAEDVAVKKWSEVLYDRYPKVSVSVVETPMGKDINGLAVDEDPAILAHLIEERITLYSSSEKTSLESNESSEERKSEVNELNVSEPQLLTWTSENLRFTLLGGVATYPLDRMKVTLKIQRTDSNSSLHALRQQLDLYQDETVEMLARKVAGPLEVGSTKLHTALLEFTGKLEADRASKVKEQGQAEKPGTWKMTAERRAAAAVASLKYGCASGVAVAGILGRCSLADGLGVRGRRPSEKLLSPQADVRNRMHHQSKLLSARVKLQIADKLDSKIKTLGQLLQSRIAVWVELHGLRNAQYLSGLRSVISVEHYQKSKLEDLQKAVGKHHPLK